MHWAAIQCCSKWRFPASSAAAPAYHSPCQHFTAATCDADFYATFQTCIGCSYLELLVWCRPGLLIQFRWTGFRMSWIFILSRISWRLSWLIWGLIPSNRAEHIWKYLEIGPDPGDWTACQTSSSLTGIWWPVRPGLVKSDVLRKDQYRSNMQGTHK